MRFTDMTQQTFDLHQLMLEEEDKAMERTKREMAEEQGAWDALPQEEKDRINAARREQSALDEFAVDDEQADWDECWDCGVKIDPDEDDGEGYCPDCAVDHEED
jgi:hypothetical protein